MIAKLTIKSLNALEALKEVSRDDEGAALVEYGLLIGLIAVVCMVGIGALGSAINTLFDDLATKLPAVP